MTDWSLDSDWLVYEGFISRQFSNLRWLNVLLHPMSYKLQLSIVQFSEYRLIRHLIPYVCVDLALTLGWVGSVS